MVGNIVEAGLKHEQTNREVQVPNTALPRPVTTVLSQLYVLLSLNVLKRSQLNYVVTNWATLSQLSYVDPHWATVVPTQQLIFHTELYCCLCSATSVPY